MTEIIRTRREWRQLTHSLVGTKGFVPTMGALHEGHLSLIDASAKSCDHTLVSIFVNPLQFGQNEDLDSYPRRLQKDVEQCEARGVRAVFAPAPHEMYDDNHQSLVVNFDIENLYCGAYRSGHFRGVLTVVLKLLLLSNADKAFFGEKDRQQLFLIQKMARDLDLSVDIVGCPILREVDGLAMSSRNEYLSESQRRTASSLFKILNQMAKSLREGKSWNEIKQQGSQQIVIEGFDSCQYLELASQKSLLPLSELTEDAFLLAAAYMGSTRLIDNISIEKN